MSVAGQIAPKGRICAASLCERIFTDIYVLTGQIESNYDEVTDSFDAMNLKPELLRGM